MKTLKIVEWPDEILTQRCEPVVKVTTEVTSLASDMLHTLTQTNNGVGLAAPQIGQSIRLFVMKIGLPLVFINPVIVNKSKGTILFEEGCLSFPGKTKKVKRAKWVAVEFLDELGNKKHRKFHQLEAICVQHEMDHLDGVCSLED